MGITANQTHSFTGFFKNLKDLFFNLNYFSYILLKSNGLFNVKEKVRGYYSLSISICVLFNFYDIENAIVYSNAAQPLF